MLGLKTKPVDQRDKLAAQLAALEHDEQLARRHALVDELRNCTLPNICEQQREMAATAARLEKELEAARKAIRVSDAERQSLAYVQQTRRTAIRQELLGTASPTIDEAIRGLEADIVTLGNKGGGVPAAIARAAVLRLEGLKVEALDGRQLDKEIANILHGVER